MRVLFLESFPMWIHGLPNGFRDIGHEVLISGPLKKESLLPMIDQFKPNLIVSLGWTAENTGEKADWIQQYVRPTGIPYVFWATEDPAYTECFSLPFIQKTHPDFVFTICAERVSYYKALGIRSAQMGFGYHKSVHHRINPIKKYKASIAVVANAYPQYLEAHPECYRIKSIKTLITPLIKQNIRIDFWGHDWEKMSSIIGCDVPKEWLHGYLDYTEANKVYSSADITLGLQNSQITQRTYEILGSGGFYLTNETPPIKQLFGNKQGLVISSSPEHTLELVDYYLKHPEVREQVRNQARHTVAKDSYVLRAAYMVNTLIAEKII